MKPNNQSNKYKLITSYEEAKRVYYGNEGGMRDFYCDNPREVVESYEKIRNQRK